MRFPLPRSPFPPLQLSPAQVREFELLTQALIEQTVDEYQHYVHVQNREVDKTKWKHLKTRENMSVFRAFGDHENDPHLLSHESLMTPQAAVSQRHAIKGGVRLLGVGSIVGNLADLMFAATTVNDGDMKIKSSYIPDECVDWRLLSTLKHGTEEDPFLRHTIKWVVKSPPGAASVVFRPRDMILLDFNGQVELPDGERLGYMMHHSVEIPECGEVDGLVRCHLSACYLFRAQGPNSVEVYMRSLVEGGGKSPELVTAISTGNGLIATWKLPWGGQNKKLAWMLKQAAAKRQRKSGRDAPAFGRLREKKTKDECPLCQKSVSMLRSVASCELCLEQVCSRCLTVRKISHIRRSGELVQVATAFCKQCITEASLLDTTEVVRKTCVPRGDELVYDGYTHSYSTAWSMTPMSRVQNHSLQLESTEDWERQQRSQGVAHGTREYQDQEDEPLWKQMNQLYIQAEQAYQMTRQNGDAMQQKH
ncbi:hypothetical protein Poli38472_002018 [Pythium oligandrum]|uniref:FYVE-type domain-containing protein n=1 Tax=Pythium oligandrum TaxID=41045 RepID=A0A8K1CTX4_PYTOL|nr:hypothetical protein Poli38472_002018 [Pythium oligandrum]|eukprot:TMW69862.1 hypothetical protein Poli38472_002018 [Pythium oligandrum]